MGNLQCFRDMKTLSAIPVSDSSPQQKILTEESVECFLKNPRREFFDSVETMTLPAARKLAQFSGELHLDGLISLSADEAEALSAFSGEELSLNGVKEISESVAEILVQTRCDWLSLDGLTEISVDNAANLAKFKGSVLSLEGLVNLSVETATALADFAGGYLHLFGLRNLGVLAAEALAKYEGVLCLDALLNREAIDIFSGANGRIHYSCANVVELDVAMAKNLTKQIGVRFRSLKSLSTDAAIELFGSTTIEEFVFKSLDWLTAEVADAIIKNTALFDRIEDLPSFEHAQGDAMTMNQKKIRNRFKLNRWGYSLWIYSPS